MATTNGNAGVQPTRGTAKRIIVCCDGTWQDSLGAKGGDPPSNVTRIARVIRRTCLDGTHQVINYHPGVGSGGTKLDQFTGGAFGMGLDRDIREIYNYICNNYVDGDEVILTGFSRGAFTARSVADMIASVGLLTPEGLDHFFAIFSDYENIGDENRKPSEFLYQGLKPFNGENGKDREDLEEERRKQYRDWLRDTKQWTRDTLADGSNITIKALGVWDTVGTLGVPPAPVFGIRGSAKQYFTNTQISNKVENAFQALALDEPRFAFRPCLWERGDDNKVTNLKQVWFAGNHGGVGGGWHDQQIANITLAWMCDQLSTVGVEFSLGRMKDTFHSSLGYSATHPYPFIPQPTWKLGLFKPDVKPWAVPALCQPVSKGLKCDAKDCDGVHQHVDGPPKGPLETLWATARPWALGQTRYPTSWAQVFAGTTIRRPGLALRADTETNQDTDQPMVNTNERIHSSVRVRLACEGLGTDDGAPWACEGLTQGEKKAPLWKLEKRGGLAGAEATAAKKFRPNELGAWSSEYGNESVYDPAEGDGQWRWVFEGTGKQRPYSTVLPEEPMVGYWERLLLRLTATAGKTDVWRYAEQNPPANLLKKA